LILAALIGARIYYVAFEWRIYSNDWWGILAIWNGGIAIHGALIAGTLAVVLFCRWRHQSFWDVLDVLVPSVALGQAIGRWGNFFNSEAFGVPTDLPWKLFIPYEVNGVLRRPEGFMNEQYFHPTFLYESLWNLVVFSLLIVLFYRGSKGLMKLPSGALSCIYLIAYSFGRFWIEGLRTDPLCLGALPPACEGGVRIAQLMSMAMLAIGVIGLWWLYGRKKKLPDPGRPRSLTT
ncbi:MAG: prolipoprotein diacylglyceryl transferase, partial [Prochlorococcus sp.]